MDFAKSNQLKELFWVYSNRELDWDMVVNKQHNYLSRNQHVNTEMT